MFKLPPELTIAKVEEFKLHLLEFIEKNDEINIDDSEVNRIDTIGIQLLLTTIIYISMQNKTLIWKSKSDIINQSFKQLGINDPIINQYFNDEH
ncbi:MAG: anti-sigma factor antagonist [Colwelliaceae bacterium]|nr:anti-sigma factor antagonist [Colwelliaceae bacterium]